MDDRLRGFRFYPTEEELVSFYLQNKLNGTRPEIDRVIPVLDVYNYNPPDLPRLGGDCSPPDGDQWFFFIPRREREARGGRPNRLTSRGYWKATGSPGDVYSSRTGRVIGRKKTMVFYMGRAPHGRKTLWKMNEYKATIQTTNGPSFNPFSSTPTPPQLREELRLCRIYKTSKCLRAFDRRPPSEAAHHHRHHRIPEVVATFNNRQNIPAVTTHAQFATFDYLSSGDILINSQFQSMEDTKNNQDYSVTDNEPFWDWEEINLFDI